MIGKSCKYITSSTAMYKCEYKEQDKHDSTIPHKDLEQLHVHLYYFNCGVLYSEEGEYDSTIPHKDLEQLHVHLYYFNCGVLCSEEGEWVVS